MKAALEASIQRQSGWLIPAGGGLTARNVRFFESPFPIVVHVISSLTYFILGAFQFSPSLRRRKPVWHRKAGYVLIPSRLLCALSGAWMVHFYPPIFETGTAITIIRIVVAAAIAAFICMGFAKIRERNVAAHKAWMMRAFALAIAAGTQPKRRRIRSIKTLLRHAFYFLKP